MPSAFKKTVVFPNEKEKNEAETKAKGWPSWSQFVRAAIRNAPKKR